MIRPATLDDITYLLAMITVDGGLEVPSHKWMNLSLSKISTTMTYLISKDPCMFFVYENEKGKIVGFIAGELSEIWYGTAKFATDYALYVISDQRHKQIGYKLLMHFLSEAERLGAERIMTTMPLSNFNGDSMERLLTRKGFTLSSKTYTKEL
ncbi:GNAT family N-acetyltransferase [Methylomonas koyamae]|uniref:GNAT family N-acetyltransferase n=1 Tax=Methylomonas koyamae TaxID=702114 RepID=UPI0006D2C62C|nr:GNAT family N-acetyltransferase [Methylomonas koyamae]BBL57004.1 hypothetical protein MKFW12EY_06170 [Methylomonas koyamae]